MIRSFRDTETEKIYNGQHSKQYGNIERIAYRKLMELDAAESLKDLGAA